MRRIVASRRCRVPPIYIGAPSDSSELIVEDLRAGGGFIFIVLAHEEGVNTGPDAWLGPLLFFVIILTSVIIGRVLRGKR
jgi:hypothetical protein